MSSLASLHGELARIVVVGRPLQDVLDEIVVVARQAVDASLPVSVTLIRRERSYTAAFAGQLAMDADELQ